MKGNNEVEYLEGRLGIEQELQFEFNEKKKFNCLTKPVPYCLSDAKGRKSSINKMEAMDLQTTNSLKMTHSYGLYEYYES